MEEALWALNNGFDSTWPLSAGNATKTVTDPEFPPFPNILSRQFAFDNGAAGKVTLLVTGYATANPIITASGSMTLTDGTIIQRRLRSEAFRAPQFTNAIGATNSVTFDNAGLVDSYDSQVGYTAPTPTTLTAANSSAVISAPDVNIGKALVYGFTATIPPTSDDPTPFLYQTGAKILGPASPVGTVIDATRRSLNPTQPLFDPATVAGGDPHVALGSELAPLLNTTETLGDGIYRLDSINLSTGSELVITGQVVLVVYNSVRTSDTGKITVADGASLQIQIGENDSHGLVLEGAGIVNVSQSPKKLSISTSGTFTGSPTSLIDVSNNFYGTIYLPKDDVTIGNSILSSPDTNIYGALVSKSVRFLGTSPSVHYDVALQQANPSGINAPFTLKQLKELLPSDI